MIVEGVEMEAPGVTPGAVFLGAVSASMRSRGRRGWLCRLGDEETGFRSSHVRREEGGFLPVSVTYLTASGQASMNRSFRDFDSGQVHLGNEVPLEEWVKGRGC